MCIALASAAQQQILYKVMKPVYFSALARRADETEMNCESRPANGIPVLNGTVHRPIYQTAATPRSIHLSPPPQGLEEEFNRIFSDGQKSFLVEIFQAFQSDIDILYSNRLKRKEQYAKFKKLPGFSTSPERNDKSWKISEIPLRLLNRKLDMGDVSASQYSHLKKALSSNVQGIQIDFDDGHCPTWKNQITAYHNIFKIVHNKSSTIKTLPVLMLRPRAWNMTEHYITINDKKPAGPLVDFGVLMFQNGRKLSEDSSGPYFYLSKLESAPEARLWNDIFTWTEKRLGLPHGNIKACVLIENIYASFEMEEILFELKDHTVGLNCGIWDYAASIIAKFGSDPAFVLPDRNKYVNMQNHFLKSYLNLTIQTCHRRGALATGGMSAVVLGKSNSSAVKEAIAAKEKEIFAGVDGFIVYDTKLVPLMENLWSECTNGKFNQIDVIPQENISAEDLLKIPRGNVTLEGLKHNIEVAILFIYNWLRGNGHFILHNAVEDSATAEISRSQVWQWIQFQSKIEDSRQMVSKHLALECAKQFLAANQHLAQDMLMVSYEMFKQITTNHEFPEFITTFLNDNSVFRDLQHRFPRQKL